MIVSAILRSVVAVAAMTASSSGEPTPGAPHPFSGWVEAHVTAFGPGIWDVSVRYGGYVSGTAPGVRGEFTGQLTQEQHAALAALVGLLPRDKRTYSFGRDPGEGPSLWLEVHSPLPTTRYWVGVITPALAARKDIQAISGVAEFLRGLLPATPEPPAAPWLPSTWVSTGLANNAMQLTRGGWTRMGASWSASDIVNRARSVRPSQLIASVRRTSRGSEGRLR
jgi:hypothetical protein